MSLRSVNETRLRKFFEKIENIKGSLPKIKKQKGKKQWQAHAQNKISKTHQTSYHFRLIEDFMHLYFISKNFTSQKRS